MAWVTQLQGRRPSGRHVGLEPPRVRAGSGDDVVPKELSVDRN